MDAASSPRDPPTAAASKDDGHARTESENRLAQPTAVPGAFGEERIADGPDADVAAEDAVVGEGRELQDLEDDFPSFAADPSDLESGCVRVCVRGKAWRGVSFLGSPHVFKDIDFQSRPTAGGKNDAPLSATRACNDAPATSCLILFFFA